jgi:hypothetical protein
VKNVITKNGKEEENIRRRFKMKKIKMIKYDECYLYATNEGMEFNADKVQLGAMLSATVNSLIKKGILTKEEITYAVELGLSTESELEERTTEAISNLLNSVAEAIKEEKPKKKAQPKKTTKKEGNK